MTRDRLPDLQKVLSVKYTKDTEEIEMDIFNDSELHKILSEVERIRGWLNEINDKTQNMKNIYSDPLYNVSKDMQAEMDSNMTMCIALGLKACGALKEFETRLDRLNDESAISRITRIQYITTKQLCSDALHSHESFLNKFKNSKMSLLRQQIKLTNQSITDEECHKLLENNKTSIFVDNYQMETKEALLQLQDLEVRHKELKKIENSLRDVKDMFTQLAFLVNKQQEQINSVEYFATQASDWVDTGNVKLEKGIQLKKRANKTKSILICTGAGILIVLFLILIM
ncbi:syntaxin-like [Arctopsyche grandis]|uniref:syntaxin-like n=1 Tax=Arctopsyche grandis TaxID=121162 RepID=UPI00406D6C04